MDEEIGLLLGDRTGKRQKIKENLVCFNTSIKTLKHVSYKKIKMQATIPTPENSSYLIKSKINFTNLYEIFLTRYFPIFSPFNNRLWNRSDENTEDQKFSRYVQ